MTSHASGWPNSPCHGSTANALLTQVVQNVIADASATMDDKWTVIFLAGRCARLHNLVVTDIPPERANACEYVHAAQVASTSKNWTQVRRELNHGGGGPGEKAPTKQKS